MKIFILLFLGLNLSALAQEISSEENKYLGYIYQQATYQLDDPQGDILLLWSAKQVPKSIVNNLSISALYSCHLRSLSGSVSYE